MTKNNDYKTHPSYGMVSISRCQSSGSVLYGSDIPHNSIITIEIATGAVRRDLNHNWYTRDGELIRIDLTPVQYAEMISNMNTQGVPCTLRWIKGQGTIENPPKLESVQKLFETEIDNTMTDVERDIKKALFKLEDAVNNNKGKKAMRDALFSLNNTVENFSKNMKFTKKQFNESMEKTIVEVKAEVESYLLDKTLQLGKEALSQQITSDPKILNDLIVKKD